MATKMISSDRLYKIRAFNPHEATHPGHKVVAEDTLTLIKLLRDQGNVVIVEPDDGRPLEYIFRKGFSEFFSDPLVISFSVGLASSLAAAAVTNSIRWIWQHRRKEHIVKSAPPIDTLLMKSTADGLLFKHTGEPLDPTALDRLLSIVQEQRSQFLIAARSRSPYPRLTVPIFLEHTARLVGWCDLEYRDGGLFSDHVYVFDRIARMKAERGELRGLSITGIAHASSCSVCKQSYIECNHVSGAEYDSLRCVNEITKATLVNVNLVAKPINRDCYLRMMGKAKASKASA